jgi:hypothetical protein
MVIEREFAIMQHIGALLFLIDDSVPVEEEGPMGVYLMQV